MNGKRLVVLLAFSAGLGGSVGCGGSPTESSKGSLTFSGSVRYGSKGVGGVLVVLAGDASLSTRTDSQGTFSFPGLSGNSFSVTPSLEGYTFTPPNYVLGRQSRSDLDFKAAAEMLKVGDTAPDFNAFDQNGRPVSLYSYRGKVILIDVSADWCGSCRVEAPQVQALYETYKDQGFQALTILVSGSAAAWASEYKVTHPVIEDWSETFSRRYLLDWLPKNVILDRTMTIRYIDVDEQEFDPVRILALIRQYL